MPRRVSRLGLILVFLIWSAILLTPKLRLLLRAQLDGLHSQAALNADYDVDFEQALREHPGDPRVLALDAETSASRKERQHRAEDEAQIEKNGGVKVERVGEHHVYNERKAALRTYDQLIEKFPREEWLIQNRLRLSTSGGFAIDVGEFVPPEYRHLAEPWLSREERLQALKIAERGARLRPNNSFYDWMRAILLFSLKRNEEALRVSESGSRKTDFDDGTLRDVNNRIAVRQMQKSLLWEERLMIAFSEQLPHLAPIRNANRAAIWQGVLAERKGNHKRALQIYEAQWKLGRVMKNKSQFSISSIVGRAVMATAWGGLTRRLSQAELDAGHDTLAKNMRILASRFAIYARRHGRSNLASEAERDAQAQDVSDGFGNVTEIIYKLPSGGDAREIYRWKWIGAICLRAILWCGLTWLALLAMRQLMKKRAATRTGDEESLDEESLSGFDVAAAAIFSTIACSVVPFMLWRLVDREALSQWIMFGDLDATSYVMENKSNLMLIMAFDRWLPFAPLACALLYGLMTALWRGRKELKNADAPSQAGCTISALAFLLVLTVDAIFTMRQIQFARQMALDNWAIGSWLGLFALPILGVVILSYLCLRFGRLWIYALRRAFRWLQNTQLLSRTLCFLLVVLSCGYFLTSILSLPLRSEADARLDHCLTRGEVALIRERIKK